SCRSCLLPPRRRPLSPETIEVLASSDLLLELLGAGAQLFVAELLQIVLERGDPSGLGDARLVGTDLVGTDLAVGPGTGIPAGTGGCHGDHVSCRTSSGRCLGRRAKLTRYEPVRCANAALFGLLQDVAPPPHGTDRQAAER